MGVMVQNKVMLFIPSWCTCLSVYYCLSVDVCYIYFLKSSNSEFVFVFIFTTFVNWNFFDLYSVHILHKYLVRTVGLYLFVFGVLSLCMHLCVCVSVRLWGDHGQSCLELAKVCLINATATGTEILKNLILPGMYSRLCLTYWPHFSHLLTHWPCFATCILCTFLLIAFCKREISVAQRLLSMHADIWVYWTCFLHEFIYAGCIQIPESHGIRSSSWKVMVNQPNGCHIDPCTPKPVWRPGSVRTGWWA